MPSVKVFTGECDGLKECVFDCSDAKQAGMYEANIRKISIYVGTKFDMGMFVSTLVDNLVEVEVPLPPTIENREIYKLQLVQYVKNQAKLETELQKLYALVYGQCTEYLTSRLQERDEFKEMHMKKNPLWLLKTIKSLTFMHEGEKGYEMTMAEADDKFRRIYQAKDMTNVQYKKVFDNMVDVIEHYGGTVGMHWRSLITTLESDTGKTYNKDTWMQDFTTKEFESAKLKSKERVLACMFLLKSDKDRYGQMLAKIQNDHVSGNGCYPQTRIAAFAMLNNWNITYERRVYNPVIASGSSFAQASGGGLSCWGCGEPGVILPHCKKPGCIKKYAAKLKKREEQGVQHVNIVHAGDKESWNENTFTDDEEFSDSFVINEYEDEEGEQHTQDGEIIKYNEKMQFMRG
jgi:hypothetical protein